VGPTIKQRYDSATPITEHGDVANLKTGSYLGIFRIDRLGYRTDSEEYEHYHPLLIAEVDSKT
jgi:hypothetical protein